MKIEDYLKEKGFVPKNGMYVRYSTPRMGYVPTTGELIIGYHSQGVGFYEVEKIDELITNAERQNSESL